MNKVDWGEVKWSVEQADKYGLSMPLGQRRQNLYMEKNPGATLFGRDYTGHALSRMQKYRTFPCQVEDIIENGAKSLSEYDALRVLHSIDTKRVVVTEFVGRSSRREVTTFIYDPNGHRAFRK